MLWWRLTQLKSENVHKRREAAIALGKTGDTRAVEPLIVALKDSDEGVRWKAAEALGRIGDARAVEPLIVSLKDSDLNVRHRAVMALKALRYDPADETQQAMVFVANREWDNAVKLRAVAVEPLIVALKDSDFNVRWEAAEALGRIGDTRAVEPLIGALKDYVGSKAAWALGEIGDARAVEPLIGALKDSEKGVRREAAQALRKIGDAAVEPLIVALKDSQVGVRYEAAQALRAFDYEPTDEKQKAVMFVALGQWDDAVKLRAEAVEPLIDALAGYRRKDAAKSLIKIGGATVPALVNALNDNRTRVREGAAETLGIIGDARAVKSLIALLKDSSKDMRHEAAIALGMIGEAKVVEALERISDARAFELYIASMSFLEDFVKARGLERSERFVTARAQIAEVMEAELRRRIDDAGSRIGYTPAVKPLIAALEDSDPYVRYRAAQALRDLNYEPTDEKQRALMFVALGQWDDAVKLGAEAVEPLIATIMNSDKRLIDETAWSVGWHPLGPRFGFRALSLPRWLYDASECERAAEALGNIGDPRAVKPLFNLLTRVTWNHSRLGDRSPHHVEDSDIGIVIAEALKRILEHNAADAPLEDLRSVANLKIVYQWETVNYNCGGGYFKRMPFDCSFVKQLARQELIRRGIEA